MKTVRIYHLAHLSPTLFQHLIRAQVEAARAWNLCMELHKQARMTHARWPGRKELEQATKGRFALNAQVVQQISHAFLANIVHMKYPWRTKRYYPVKWPAQAVHREQGRVALPMGRGCKSLVLPIHLPEHAGVCTLVWNHGFELHVCIEVEEAEAPPGGAQATIDLGEIHLAAVTTNTGAALIVTGRGIRSLKRQRLRQLGQLAKKQSRCTKHSRRWKKLQRAKNKHCRRAEQRIRAMRHKAQYISLKDRPQEVQVQADQAHRQNRGTALLARTAQVEVSHVSSVCTCDRSA